MVEGVHEIGKWALPELPDLAILPEIPDIPILQELQSVTEHSVLLGSERDDLEDGQCNSVSFLLDNNDEDRK